MGKLEISGRRGRRQVHKLEQIWKLAEGEPYDATICSKIHGEYAGEDPGPQVALDNV